LSPPNGARSWFTKPLRSRTCRQIERIIRSESE
jgi:hypothetical protein